MECAALPGVLWTQQAGYRGGLGLLLIVGIVAAGALVLAQRRSLLCPL